MTIYFVGGEMGAFVPSDSAVVESALYYDASFARCSILSQRDTNYVEGDPGSSLTDVWIRFDIATGSIASATQTRPFSWLDGSGTERVRIKYAGSGTNLLTVEYWNGASFTALTAVSLNMQTIRQTIDLHVVCNTASGSINLYVAGNNRLNSGTIDLSATTALRKFRFYGGTVSTLTVPTYVSQVIVADEPTIGWRALTRYPNGAGATGDWTGDYTSVDETIYNDADFINSSTNGQVETFTQTGPAITGYVVRAVCVAARAKKGASGPANVQLALRVSGTDYFSSSKALDLGYGAHFNIWEQNPATTADWINTAIDAVQPGVKAIT